MGAGRAETLAVAAAVAAVDGTGAKAGKIGAGGAAAASHPAPLRRPRTRHRSRQWVPPRVSWAKSDRSCSA